MTKGCRKVPTGSLPEGFDTSVKTLNLTAGSQGFLKEGFPFPRPEVSGVVHDRQNGGTPTVRTLGITMTPDLIPVRYRSHHVGSVDDITLDELILSHRIGQFYRPSQEKWVHIDRDPVRTGKGRPGRYGRRMADREEEAEGSEARARGLLSGVLRRKRKARAPGRKLTAGDWFERGFRASQAHDDRGAVRAFAKSIDLDPACQSAYLHRGITYEAVGNLQQSVYDYSKVIELAPGDAQVYYLRGLACLRLGMAYEAIEDLKKAARMGYRQALDFFKSRDVYL